MTQIITHSYISSYNLPNSTELLNLLNKTNNDMYMTSEADDSGDTHSQILWADGIDNIEDQYKDNDDELTTDDSRLITLLEETYKIMEESKAEFILFHM